VAQKPDTGALACTEKRRIPAYGLSQRRD